jgi:hypothetical protein
LFLMDIYFEWVDGRGNVSLKSIDYVNALY